VRHKCNQQHVSGPHERPRGKAVISHVRIEVGSVILLCIVEWIAADPTPLAMNWLQFMAVHSH
jgi:hypothetical protein